MATTSQQVYDIIDAANKASTYGKWFLLWPDSWALLNSPLQFAWQKIKFTRSDIMSAPDDAKGVYTFVIEPGIADHPGCKYLCYIGMTEDQVFRKRFSDYFDELTRTKPRRWHIVRLMRQWPDHLYCYYAVVPSGINSESVEENLIESFIPPDCRRLPVSVRDIVKAFPNQR